MSFLRSKWKDSFAKLRVSKLSNAMLKWKLNEKIWKEKHGQDSEKDDEVTFGVNMVVWTVSDFLFCLFYFHEQQQ